ncbi:hypothetical protein BZA05DRAFT_128555 [Tricharina praecox]|uniref:uncharacterized protein n=1 Tax=Tricharina praecox TaxID=43433 RepID=UPI002220BEEC|nr:uncharacterized protein BZA05DRAFT_128555 [Tricharina praecox]KAI5846842.1 hypothetical protein BZA05DRAFT_128555 [Tricharina praecox]
MHHETATWTVPISKIPLHKSSHPVCCTQKPASNQATQSSSIWDPLEGGLVGKNEKKKKKRNGGTDSQGITDSLLLYSVVSCRVVLLLLLLLLTYHSMSTGRQQVPIIILLLLERDSHLYCMIPTHIDGGGNPVSPIGAGGKSSSHRIARTTGKKIGSSARMSVCVCVCIVHISRDRVSLHFRPSSSAEIQFDWVFG